MSAVTQEFNSPEKRDVLELGAQQIDLYKRQAFELVSHYNREVSALDGYRGRQLLELLQNADDAGVGTQLGCKFYLDLSRRRLLAANTGNAFDRKGLTSLVISDCSPKQLEQNRFIGCKGLGFRATLTWTDRPLISSGQYEIVFDRLKAVEIVQALCLKQPELAEVVAPFRNSIGRWPAAVMRFPTIPSEDDPWLGEARDLRRRGYETAIVLPLPAGSRGNEIYADMAQQISQLPTSSLLFCRHLTRVQIAGDIERIWELLRQDHNANEATIVLQQDGRPLLWNVYRRTGQVSSTAAETSSGGRREFEVAVAVPDEPKPNPSGALCVFFPTHDQLPCSLIMHATLETSDDRNRLVNHASNREVLQELARHVAQALEIRASPSDPLAALRLLAGVENADPELKNLGFLETLVQECSKRTIFPRLDGKMDLSKNIWQVPHRIWLEVLDPHFFPDVLAIDPEKTLSNLLRLFELPWIDSALLRERLRQQILSMSRAEAGEMVGSLLADGQLRQVGTNGLLIDSKGKLISGSGSFVTPTEKLPALPSWASEIRFLDEDFQNGLLRKSRAGSARLLTSDLSGVDEYRFDTVARALIQQVDKGVEDDSATIIERWREVLRWLLEASTGARQVLPQLAIEVVTTRGTLRRATSCYLGKDYPRGQIASRLYERFGNDEFVASAPENGLGGLPLEEAEEFLLALGVDSMPRPEPFRSGRDYDRFCESVLDRLEYPRQIRGHWCTSPDDLRRLCRDYEIKGISLPDRWLRVLAEGDAVALSAYLLSTGGNLISEEIDQVARFQTKLSGERALWADHSVPIPNATLYFLRGSAWIPSIDGSRHRPSEIMLSSHGVRVLRGVYSRHALDAKDELLASYGGREALESLLTRLGAVSSLEMLSGQSLYELLLTLPERDPNGEVAPGIYRTLLEEGITVDESSHRDKFFESGKMWGRHQGRKLYLPVRRLRYNANLTLTTSIEDRIPLVDIPRRKSAAFVRQLFGVPALSPEEIHLEISIEGTEYDPGSEQANRHLQLSIPYIYALRLGQTLDEQGRAANLLRKAVLRVCNRAQISAVLLGEPPESVVLETPGDRFVIDTSLVVVGEYRQDAPWFLTFWLTVAELVAELLGTDIADEVGGILRCRTTSEMLEVVRVRLGADADAKLTEAQSRFRDLLQETDSDTERSIPSPSPVSYREYPQPSSHASPPIQTPEQSERAPLTGPNLLPGAGATFQPIDGPSSAPSKRRKLVITAMSANPCRGSGPLATEDVTFKVVEAFEEHQGRFPIRVSHLHGDEAFGCDVISVASEDTRAQAIARQSITDGEVLRYIEVKGRSNRRGDLELGENQIKAAELRTVRFFIYRVYVDPHRAWHFELAALSDPLSSNAVRNVTRFDLGEGSGAAWFLFSELPTRQDADEIEASAGES